MQHIAILDFGSQYTHLIARRIRDLGVLSKIYPTDIAAADLPSDAIGIILSGGPQSVYDANGPTIDEGLLNLGKPILGLCYGHQLLAQ
ncbi:MAG: GMP synthase (glutamine-hydrolyzing), partial [Patescibacteria group bacterium]